MFHQVGQFLSHTYPAQKAVAVSAISVHTLAQGLKVLSDNFDMDSAMGKWKILKCVAL